MQNDLKNIDPDHSYTDPKTGVLRNLGGIADHEALTFAETAVTTKRLGELKAKPIKVKDSNALFAIHQYLFQDIYAWAGKRRLVEISKGGKQFFPTSHFDNALKYIDSLIAEYQHIDNSDKAGLAKKLAEILDTVNFLHPFREGNGRTQREFIRLLAIAKNYTLNLNPPDNVDIFKRYMLGAIEGNTGDLAELIFVNLSK
jgi:cell filamentation protein